MGCIYFRYHDFGLLRWVVFCLQELDIGAAILLLSPLWRLMVPRTFYFFVLLLLLKQGQAIQSFQ